MSGLKQRNVPSLSQDDFQQLQSRKLTGQYSEYNIKEQEYLSLREIGRSYSERVKPDPSKCECNRTSIKSFINSYFPIFEWMPEYNKGWAKQDIVAGLTVAILLVPQSLAYAVLAGLPEVYGLYAATIPVFIYSVMGTSTQVAIGPVAPTAIMVASGVASMTDADAGSDEYIEAALTMSFTAGIILFFMGILRLGSIVVLLSRPVMTGFIMAAAFIILVNQMKALLGLDIDRYTYFYDTLFHVITNIDTIHGWTTLVSIISISILYLQKWFPKHIPKWVPIPLLLMVLMITISAIADFESSGISIVGDDIKSGLPQPSVPNLKYFLNSIIPSFIVAIVSYMGSIALAKGFDQRVQDKYRTDMENYTNYLQKQGYTNTQINTKLNNLYHINKNTKNQNDSNIELASPSSENKKSSSARELLEVTPPRKIQTPNQTTKPKLKTKLGSNSVSKCNTNNNSKNPSNNATDIEEEEEEEDSIIIEEPQIIIDEQKGDDTSPSPSKNKPTDSYSNTSGVGHVVSKNVVITNDDDIQDDIVVAPIKRVEVSIDANKEFFAYGVANFIGSFFSSQVISASFSRSALNYDMEGHTQFSSIIQGLVCLLCLLVLMPLLAPLPSSVLASVVAASVHRLIKNGIIEFKFLRKVSRLELIEFLMAVIAPLIIGLEIGLVLAIGTSLLVAVFRHSTATIVELGQIKGTRTVEYVDLKIFKTAKPVNGVKIIEMRAELSFTNARRLVEKISSLVNSGNNYIVVSFSHTQDIDTTALRQIVQIFEDSKNSLICLSHCRSPVRQMIKRMAQLTEPKDIIAENVKSFVSTHDAVLYCESLIMGSQINDIFSKPQTTSEDLREAIDGVLLPNKNIDIDNIHERKRSVIEEQNPNDDSLNHQN